MTTNPDEATQAGPNQKGDQSLNVAFALGEVSGKVENLRTDLKDWRDGLTNAITAGDAVALAKTADLEIRVRALEKWKWMIAGAAAAGGAGVGKLVDLIAKAST